MSLWGASAPPPTAKELVKEQKKTVRKSQREIDREMRNLEKQEKTLLANIKKNATAGNTSAAKTLAKELVRTRGTMGKLQQASGRLGSIGMQASSMNATMAMTNAIKSGTEVMSAMNKQMDPMEQQAMAQRFAIENDKSQMMSDQFDEMFDSMMDSDEDAEADDMVNSVLDEIGISATAGMQVAPQGKVAAEPEPAEADPGEADLEARMAKLMGS